MPLQGTSGAASQDAFGGYGVAVVPAYIEDVFSTYLYTGTGAAQTITNGIDLSGKGGLVWFKNRSTAADHALFDTVRGATNVLQSNGASGQTSGYSPDYFNAFTSTGFSFGSLVDSSLNTNSSTYASWSFRKQPKFFDIQTWTGNSTARTIAHNLGSVPGCIMVKRIDATAQNWNVYHQSLGNEERIALDATSAAVGVGNACWNSTTPTSTVFSLGTNSGVNSTGGTYIAYLFAHDAGGFGLLGTDNVISCGTWTEDGTTQNINLGYEPQFLIVKLAGPGTSDWFMFDTMRGWPTSGIPCPRLAPNVSNGEANLGGFVHPTATGFTAAPYDGVGQKQIYIAIRRGPMKVPTLGTSVFTPLTRTGTNAAANITSAGFPPDLLIGRSKRATTSTAVFVDRLRGNTQFLQSAVTDAEGTSSSGSDVTGFLMNGFSLGTSGGTDLNSSGASEIYYPMRRAPGFFDEVCYTGTGSAATINHNLTVVPDLIIFKNRPGIYDWPVYVRSVNNNNWVFSLNTDEARFNRALFSSTPTASTMTFTGAQVNVASNTFVAYLFATCAGVSKVGSYTGTGTTLQIDCGFTAGARFVLIKRNDSTGDWYVWDSARGIIAGNDPYLLLNSTAAEVTGTDYIDTYSAGFEISSTAPAAINANGGTYIFLAIA
jgi:hypothetical protein